MHDDFAATTEVSTNKITPNVMMEDKIEDAVKAAFHVVEPLRADESPDTLRTDLEEALDTLSYNFGNSRLYLQRENIVVSHCRLRMRMILL